MRTDIQSCDAALCEPPWLSVWKSGSISTFEALARFDALPELAPEAMIGQWRGTSLATGHPLDGLLEKLGWYGKAFECTNRVDPLLFRDASGVVTALDPALMPVAVALRAPRVAHSRAVSLMFAAVRPLLRTHRSAAVLQTLEFRGRRSAAMVYDHKPIVDHFRRIDERRTLGLMDMQDRQQPFFFLLARDGTPVRVT
jgi:hypothetical protein